MPWTDQHLQWLIDTGKKFTLACGAQVPVFEFRHQKNDTILSAWAKHLRNHYCLDTDIDALRNGTPLSRAEYLKSIKFPDVSKAPGPSIRSGDVAEILVADYVEFSLKYWVPRTRYRDKTVRNESTKGSDVLGFHIVTAGKDSKTDTLAIWEAKAQLSSAPTSSRLQNAVDDSVKDQLRKAESLNAIKQRLLADNDIAGIQRVERFQNPEDRPYAERYGAVVVFSTAAFSQKTECAASTVSHPFAKDLAVMVIHGKDLMTLVHDLFERAAHEA